MPFWLCVVWSLTSTRLSAASTTPSMVSPTFRPVATVMLPVVATSTGFFQVTLFMT
jgi:hypothetical protein